MAAEIERKFLVTSDAWQKNVVRWHNIYQGYLSKGLNTVRVRLRDQAAIMTVKGCGTLVRVEHEFLIPQNTALELLKMCPDPIAKRRYIVRFAGKNWEVDVFEGRHKGLVLAEIEFSDPDEMFTLPPWVGDDVTEDTRYVNSNIAELSEKQIEDLIANKKTCNQHEDCGAADSEAAKAGKRTYHCYDSDCEDCFPK